MAQTAAQIAEARAKQEAEAKAAAEAAATAEAEAEARAKQEAEAVDMDELRAIYAPDVAILSEGPTELVISFTEKTKDEAGVTRSGGVVRKVPRP